MRWTPQSLWKEERWRCYIKGRTYFQRCHMQGHRLRGEVRRIVQVCDIKTLHDPLAARMLGRHAHITLTCHLLTAYLFCVAHPRVRDQTIRPRYPEDQQERYCGGDLAKEFHWGANINVLVKFESAASKKLQAIGKS